MRYRMRHLLATTTRILFSAAALAGVCGFATCGSDVREEDPAYESRGEATTDEMMEDAARDTDL
jgi:hypothetical protein